jgi:hypothetical protein
VLRFFSAMQAFGATLGQSPGLCRRRMAFGVAEGEDATLLHKVKPPHALPLTGVIVLQGISFDLAALFVCDGLPWSHPAMRLCINAAEATAFRPSTSTLQATQTMFHLPTSGFTHWRTGLQRSLCLMLLAFAASLSIHAQCMVGYTGSNYAGYSTIAFNPALLAQTPYALDLNVTSVQVGFDNDFLSLRNDGFFGSKTLRGSYDDFDDFRDRALIVNFDGTESGQTANFRMGLDVLGPGALIPLSPHSSLSVGTRFRSMVNVEQLGAEAARLALDAFEFPPLVGSELRIRWRSPGGDVLGRIHGILCPPALPNRRQSPLPGRRRHPQAAARHTGHVPVQR